LDYQVFHAWLQLSPPRSFRKSAVALGCSVARLRRLSTRHDWPARAAAFDNARADAAGAALDDLLRDEKLDWQERARRFRLQEWALHSEMIEAAFATLRELRKAPRRIKLSELVRLIDLASQLGRRATEASGASGDVLPRAPSAEFQAAVAKIYGTPLPTEQPGEIA
jgi:hypothetical protein